mmetsp:Transcript_2367/g.4283  ORF Transcript_2367/g.4283 Transcript_2367/m.4283 type:complete len:156 (-) Transcript_2367:142-609(-)|eukprot:CAMPEP_0197631166 /NCGR_PEP_ID=MMETSP1338-20131121/8427_1 /TAXON_ID=43686 ORGANISM="Pelagodinium beii, Strain RCC1491" /NCGR_SAMPLE_ID=MMETSP1338 /ASSEMBLY_ACC=CAM_ASM_000754 /LENGTH=155 /DNA_ID=CAMNT_0043202567 /DNA_START=78 /DNA_END=545 /DNA_ORIENTATION=-
MQIWALASALLVVATAAEDGYLPIQGVRTTYKILTEAAADAPVVEVGDKVTVHATGIVAQTNKKFWSTKDKGQQMFTYTAGGGVITGWDMGARGMGKGEVRSLHIPADEGYGAGGFPAWGIPPNGDLIFELEVHGISKNGKEKEPSSSRKISKDL